MKINQSVNYTFGTKPILPAKIKGKTGNLIRVTFSMLDPNKTNDLQAIREIASNWIVPHKSTNYANNIANFFQMKNNNIKFFCIELSNKTKKLNNKIKSIIVTSNPDDINKELLEIHILQSSPDIIMNPQEPYYKGAGISAIYGIVKLALIKGFKKINLISTNDSFYEHIGFKSIKNTDPSEKINFFELEKDKFITFIKNYEEKYLKAKNNPNVFSKKHPNKSSKN